MQMSAQKIETKGFRKCNKTRLRGQILQDVDSVLVTEMIGLKKRRQQNCPSATLWVNRTP